uniref:Uncharacterized protein n=1 Tax=Anguilla anguilla TaxID=7936 RepID=A0A0E9VIF7_ANGAN
MCSIIKNRDILNSNYRFNSRGPCGNVN